jgi:hypothetical protein
MDERSGMKMLYIWEGEAKAGREDVAPNSGMR